MSAQSVYHEIRAMLAMDLGATVGPVQLDRLTLLGMGTLRAESASPARVAKALAELRLTEAKTASHERQVRRIENDPKISAETCVHPLARRRLVRGQPRELVLIVDPTTQEDRVVLVPIAVWYQGRALPLVWTTWPANTPLKGKRFWERINELLDKVQRLLPAGVPITVVADRAFGSPAFIDLVVAHGWHYVVRVQDRTHYQDRGGHEAPLRSLVPQPGDRAKLHGQAFKKMGWREVSIVVFWGQRHQSPLCLVSDLKADWALIALYKRRFPIEATFRDYKSAGWHWEQGQVTDPEHIERLLVGMALALWVAVSVGAQVAAEILARPATGHRRTVPWEGKYSLFALGVHQIHIWMSHPGPVSFTWHLFNWEAPNWRTQIYAHHAYAYIFEPCPTSRQDSKVRGPAVRP